MELFKRLQDNIAREIVAIAVQIEGRLREFAPVGATANLRNSINTSFRVYDDGVILEIGSPLEYASYVEFGTKPHRPPFEPIKLWVERKIQPHVISVKIAYEGGRAVPVGAKKLTGKKRENIVRNVTWAVIKKIERFGTPEQKFVRRALDELNIPYEVQFYEGGAVIDLDVSGKLKSKALI